MNPFLILVAICSMFFLPSCEPDRDTYSLVPDKIDGYRPVYFDTSQNVKAMVYSEPPKPVMVSGKIYIYQQYLFVGEPGKGVHVFDNTDPANPIPVSFINIPYNFDIAIKDTVLYADTYMGLIVIGISQFPKISVISFIKSLSNASTGIPPLPPSRLNGTWRIPARTYFECIDFRKGLVVGWEEVSLMKPKCYK